MKCLFLVLLLAAAAVAAKHTKDDPECMWHDFLKHDNISAWEFQAQPHRHMVKHRDKAIRKVEALLEELSADPDSGVQWVPGSRWMSIFEEVSFQVSSRHGHPIHRDPEDPKAKPFPWKGLGYLRLRIYKVLTPAGAHVPSAMPGMADLTFKMKMVDPDVGPGEVKLPKMVGSAKLTAKVEQDLHCDHARPTMSPLYRPVSQQINVSKVGNVKDYFPNLAHVAMLDEDEPLPFMHDVWRAKIVWVVVFRGVIGEANLVIKYNTRFEDAVAGEHPKNGEVSLRIRREVAEATGTTGEEGKKRLYAALDAIGYGMQAFRDAGWDGKTPPLSKKKHDKGSDGHKHPEGSGCGCLHREMKHCEEHGAAMVQQDDAGLVVPRALLKPNPSAGGAAAGAGAGAGEDAAGNRVDVAAVAAARGSAVKQQAQLRFWQLPWWQEALQRLRTAAAAGGAEQHQGACGSTGCGEGVECGSGDGDFDYDEPVFANDDEQSVQQGQEEEEAGQGKGDGATTADSRAQQGGAFMFY